MNTFQLECFVAVVEHLNFTKAAEQLHVTHPAVSQQIRSLEKELGVRLFQRSTRSVRLTKDGATFLGDALQMLAIARRSKARFAHAAVDTMESLILGAYNYGTMILLQPALAQLHESHPYLHPSLKMIPFQHIYRSLDDGELDAVIAFQASPERKVAAAYKELVQAPLVCVLTAGHPLAARTALTLDDLRDEKLVLLAPPRAERTVVQVQGQLMGERPVSDFYLCDSIEAMHVLVGAGYGIAVMPALLVPPVDELAWVPIEDVAPVSFGLYHRPLEDTPLLRELLPLLAKSLQEWL